MALDEYEQAALALLAVTVLSRLVQDAKGLLGAPKPHEVEALQRGGRAPGCKRLATALCAAASVVVILGPALWVSGVAPSVALPAAAAAAEGEGGGAPLAGLEDEGGLLPGPAPLAPGAVATLSFSLCNAAPDASYAYAWDFRAFEARFVAPVAAALAPAAALRAESQVLYHTRAAVEPRWDAEHAAHVLDAAKAPFFVDQAWTLDTTLGNATTRVLHFAVYVPPREHCPLHVLEVSGEKAPTNGLVVPGWGAVLVWNPPGCGAEEERSGGGVPRELTQEELAPLAAAAVGQLRTLLGVPPPAAGADVAPESGFAAWEVDALVRRAARDGVRGATDTLAALSASAGVLSGVAVPREMAALVDDALASVAEARAHARAGEHVASAAAARDAHRLAAHVFFHHDVASDLYMLPEHIFALFAPVAIPLLMPVCTAVAFEVRRQVLRRRLSAAYVAAAAADDDEPVSSGPRGAAQGGDADE